MKRVMLLLFVLSLLMSMPVLAQAKGGPGAVYAMTNAIDNEIVVYHRAANGALTLVDTFDTGGEGTGDALGASNSLILSPDHRWLFAVNAGSNEISVFKVDQDRLTLLEVISSAGEFPVSLTIHQDLLYVLNAGGDGNISYYKVGADGRLSLIGEIDGNAPVDLAITPNGQYLYTVNAGDGSVGMFKIDQKNGNLIPLGEIGGLPDGGSAVGIAAR